MDILTQPVVIFVAIAALIVSIPLLVRMHKKRKRAFSEAYLEYHTKTCAEFAEELEDYKVLTATIGAVEPHLVSRFNALHTKIDLCLTEDMQIQLRAKLLADDELVIISQKQTLVRMKLEIEGILRKGRVD